MALYIRDVTVDILADQLRERLGSATKTDAVRRALMNELARLERTVPLRDKLAEIQNRATETLGLPITGVDLKQLADRVWEEIDDVR